MLQKLRPKAAAKSLGVSASYLNQLRVKGGGPAYSKIGKRIVLYDEADLREWADAQLRRSTSGPDQVGGTL
jgi:predicted DNA-binding transcriptional regulator AlpA